MTKSKQSRSLAALAFITLCVCYMVPNYAQYQVSPLGPQILEQYNLSLSQLSSLFSAPMIPAIFFSLLGGILIDRFGYRGIVGAGMILTALGCVWRVVSSSYTPLLIATLLTGFSACFISAAGGKIIGTLYSPDLVPSKMGILMAASTGAMTIANLTTAYFPSIQSAFVLSSVFAVVCSVLWFVFIRKPEAASEEGNVPSEGILSCLKVASKCSGIWLIAFALFFIMAANVAIGSFLPTALGSRGISAEMAGTLAALYTVGNLLGCFAAPAAIRKLNSQKKTLLIFALLSAIGVALAWHIDNALLLGIALLLTGTFLGGMIPTLMGLPVQFSAIGPVYAGTAGGIIGTVQLLGAVLLPSYVLAPLANGNFTILYFLAGGCLLLAGGLSLCIRDIS